MSFFAVLLIVGGLVGVFVGMALQRARRAWSDWRKTVRAIPVVRAAFFVEARHAAWLLCLSGAVLLAVTR